MEVCSSKADRSAQVAGEPRLAGGFHHDFIDYSLGVTELDVTSGVGGDAPYRDSSLQGSVTFHFSPSLHLTARLYAGDSFGKVMGEPDLIGNLTGFGIVKAIPLAPSQARLYGEGVPLAQLNVGNATFIPAPDDPDSHAPPIRGWRADPERTAVEFARVFGELPGPLKQPPLWQRTRGRGLSARRAARARCMTAAFRR